MSLIPQFKETGHSIIVNRLFALLTPLHFLLFRHNAASKGCQGRLVTSLDLPASMHFRHSEERFVAADSGGLADPALSHVTD